MDEASLCASSCLRILKSVCSSLSNFELVLECLQNIETCLSLLHDTATLLQELQKQEEKMNRMVEESFQVATKWCKLYHLKSKVPCYAVDEAENEFQVGILLSIGGYECFAVKRGPHH